MRLNKLLNSVETGECEADALDLLVVGAFFTDRVLRERQAVVVLDRGEALVRQLDEAIREGEDAIELEDAVHVDSLVIEGGALDHSTLSIDQVKVEELATAPSVLPGLDGCLFDDSRLDRPVVGELVESLDGHVGAGGSGLLDTAAGHHDSVGNLSAPLGLLRVSPDWAGSVRALVHFDLFDLLVLEGGGLLSARQLQVIRVWEGVSLLVLGVVLRCTYLTIDVLSKDFGDAPQNHYSITDRSDEMIND